jgi:hypothetical protein
MTIWPGVPLAPPPLHPRRGRYQLDAASLALIGTDGWAQIERADRREIYLKLYSVDLADPSAIVAFASSYGTPSGAFIQSALSGHSWFNGLFDANADLQLLQEVHRRDPSLRRRMEPGEPEWELIDVVTLDSIRFATRLLSDLTDAWRLASLDPTFDSENHRWRLPYRLDGEIADNRFFAMQLLESGLTPLVAGFRPYISGTTVPEGEDDEEHEAVQAAPNGGVFLEAARSMRPTHLAEFCALELFNHIVQAETYRICQNENCSRVFVLQYGRESHGMSKREGVMYCSASCAQAQASRSYRRRQKAKREGRLA